MGRLSLKTINELREEFHLLVAIQTRISHLDVYEGEILQNSVKMQGMDEIKLLHSHIPIICKNSCNYSYMMRLLYTEN